MLFDLCNHEGASLRVEMHAWETNPVGSTEENFDQSTATTEGGDLGQSADTTNTNVTIPAQALKLIAARHNLSERVVTAAWLVLRQAGRDAKPDETTVKLQELAKEMVGAEALDELAQVK